MVPRSSVCMYRSQFCRRWRNFVVLGDQARKEREPVCGEALALLGTAPPQRHRNAFHTRVAADFSPGPVCSEDFSQILYIPGIYDLYHSTRLPPLISAPSFFCFRYWGKYIRSSGSLECISLRLRIFSPNVFFSGGVVWATTRAVPPNGEVRRRNLNPELFFHK